MHLHRYCTYSIISSVSTNFKHMIKSNYTTALAAGLVSVVSIGAALPSSAQHGPRDYQRTALTAMKEGKWQEALDAVDRCIRVYEPRIKTLGLDDGFGWFYYQKGVCPIEAIQGSCGSVQGVLHQVPERQEPARENGPVPRGGKLLPPWGFCQGRGAAGEIPEGIPQRPCSPEC